MINKVAFTGRETMLTAGLNKVVKPKVVKASSILPGLNPIELTEFRRPVVNYTSPFAPTKVVLPDKQNLMVNLTNEHGIDGLHLFG